MVEPAKGGIDLVTGKPRDRFCSIEGLRDGYCGPKERVLKAKGHKMNESFKKAIKEDAIIAANLGGSPESDCPLLVGSLGHSFWVREYWIRMYELSGEASA